MKNENEKKNKNENIHIVSFESVSELSRDGSTQGYEEGNHH